MTFDPARPPAAPPLVGSAAAALGGAAVLAVCARWSGVEGSPAALQLAVALQTVGLVALLVAAVFCACHWQVRRRAPSAYLAVALVVFALGVAPLGGLVGSLAPGASGEEVHDEAVGLAVTGVAVWLCLAALRERHGSALSVRALVLRVCVLLAACVVVLVVLDRVAVALTVDLGVLRVGLDLVGGGLWLGLSALLWRRRAFSPWVLRGASAAAALVVVRGLDAAAGDVQGGAAHLAATTLGACFAALVCWSALVALAEAVSAARAEVEVTARRLDEATGKVLARDAWREELRHDAVNAIAGLRAALSLVASEGARLDVPTTRRLLAAALTETSHLEHLVAGGSADRAVVVDVTEVVGSVVAARRAGGLDVELRAVPGPDPLDPAAAPRPVLATGCAGDLVAVLQNLMHNVRVHAPGSRVVVDVTRDRDRVGVAVRDDGPGIDAGLRGRVFDRGVSGPTGSGTGLGLFVARQLMRAQGGDLVLVPSGAGCHLLATLPAALPSAPTSVTAGTAGGQAPSVGPGARCAGGPGDTRNASARRRLAVVVPEGVR